MRINLSEQTDVSDLLGSDLPVPDADPAEGSADRSSEQSGAGGGAGARFAWCDGVFLSALKAGKWMLLDDLNLATQVNKVGRCGKQFVPNVVRLFLRCAFLLSKRAAKSRRCRRLSGSITSGLGVWLSGDGPQGCPLLAHSFVVLPCPAC